MKSSKKQKKATDAAAPAPEHHHTYLEEEIPDHHEFPEVGHVHHDFVNHDHGRTTHRMIDHEPGTF